MTELQSDTQNNSPASLQNQQGTDIYKDEINLVDYFLVIWKHKSLILIGSILPALIVGAILYFSPRTYELTYIYDCDLTEQNYKVYFADFYGVENTNKIKAKKPDYNSEKVKFDVWPSFVGVKNSTTQLLNVTIKDRPEKQLQKTSLVIRDNVENIMPIYSRKRQIAQAVRQYKEELTIIERDRFDRALDLERNKNILAGLKKIKTESSDQPRIDLLLQFDIGQKAEYLPLAYQLQAAESKIIELQEDIRANEKKHIYQEKLLAINEKLLQELEEKSSVSYSIKDFHTFLADMNGSYEDETSTDYLKSYTREIENRISVSAPVSGEPQVLVVPKGTVKKSGMIFVVAFILSVFVSFLREDVEKTQRPTS